MNKTFEKIKYWADYNIELITAISITILGAINYGFLESWYIDTDSGKFTLIPYTTISYYHLFLLSMMFICSFSLAITHLFWIVKHKKKYVFFICSACMVLSLVVEDITWYISRWKPIQPNDWNVCLIKEGWGISLGFTFLPLTYIIAILVSIFLFWLGDHYATKGYEEFKKKNKE